MDNNTFQEILKNQVWALLGTANTLLSNMTTDELDAIPTMNISKENHDFVRANGSIISVYYPNEAECINIYFFGSGFVKLNSEQSPAVSDTTQA